MRKFALAFAAASMTLPMALPAPASAQNGYYNGKTWRDNNGRLRCKKKNGTTGLIVGGVAGALAGRAVDTRGDRTAGTLVGAAAGAVLGREIDRGGSKGRYCR